MKVPWILEAFLKWLRPCKAVLGGITFVGVAMLPVASEADPGFADRYQRDFNIFSEQNRYHPENPLNPANQYAPDNPWNPTNRYDPDNPVNPINQFRPNNPDNPINRFHPENPRNPVNRYDPTVPFGPLE